MIEREREREREREGKTAERKKDTFSSFSSPLHFSLQ
jgi:hypothetical protein